MANSRKKNTLADSLQKLVGKKVFTTPAFHDQIRVFVECSKDQSEDIYVKLKRGVSEMYEIVPPLGWSDDPRGLAADAGVTRPYLWLVLAPR